MIRKHFYWFLSNILILIFLIDSSVGSVGQLGNPLTLRLGRRRAGLGVQQLQGCGMHSCRALRGESVDLQGTPGDGVWDGPAAPHIWTSRDSWLSDCQLFALPATPWTLQQNIQVCTRNKEWLSQLPTTFWERAGAESRKLSRSFPPWLGPPKCRACCLGCFMN